ncbi:FG-GAP-like repeat-containing protein [Streptomyces sp. NPDC003717]|uniref:FG-GAP-like repeat-containing protein n=1 Tax=Streptomyces sp. NPDC003717 TaxID=3154276 RepID=UPI0033B2C47F
MNGPTPQDDALAAQLGPQMTSKMAGALDAGNVSCAGVITAVVKQRGLSRRAAQIAVTTAITESTLHDYTGGDRDSLGLFQQRPSTGWGTPDQITNPVYATNKFLDVMLGLFPDNSWETTDIGAVCQAVQKSGAPDAYAPEAPDADVLVGALWEGSAQPSVPAASTNNVRIDLDGDGRADLLSVQADGTLRVFRNKNGFKSGGMWDGGVDVGSGWSADRPVVPGDLDGDGKTDLLGVRPDGSLWAHRATGTFANAQMFPRAVNVGSGWGGQLQMITADLDGDKRADLLSVLADGTLRVFRNKGGFGGQMFDDPGVDVGSGWSRQHPLIPADLDGDGRTDLLGLHDDGTLWAFRSTGRFAEAQMFAEGIPVGGGWGSHRQLFTTNLDADTRADLVAVTSDGTLRTFHNDGGFTQRMFGDGVNVGGGWTVERPAIPADLDADGRADLLGTQPDGGLQAYRNTGVFEDAGLFGAPVGVGSGWGRQLQLM